MVSKLVKRSKEQADNKPDAASAWQVCARVRCVWMRGSFETSGRLWWWGQTLDRPCRGKAVRERKRVSRPPAPNGREVRG